MAQRAQSNGTTAEEELRLVTDQAALRYIPSTEEYARTLLFFASPLSDAVTGQSLHVNGGPLFSLSPMRDSAASRLPLVIAVSINGEKSKSINPNIPRSHAEIVATAIACYDAGASILHAHNSDTSMTGAQAAEDYLLAWRQVRALRPGALWYPTLTRSGGQELEHVKLIDEAIGIEFACVDPAPSLSRNSTRTGCPQADTT